MLTQMQLLDGISLLVCNTVTATKYSTTRMSSGRMMEMRRINETSGGYVCARRTYREAALTHTAECEIINKARIIKKS